VQGCGHPLARDVTSCIVGLAKKSKLPGTKSAKGSGRPGSGRRPGCWREGEKEDMGEREEGTKGRKGERDKTEKGRGIGRVNPFRRFRTYNASASADAASRGGGAPRGRPTPFGLYIFNSPNGVRFPVVTP
jgi:hypothetical protein